jgi:predicted nucleotidyltransferase
MRLPDDIRRAVIRQLESLSPMAVYLFGSYGTPAQHPGSDLDFAILARDSINPVLLFELANTLSNRLGREVDLLDLSTASTVMAKEVLRTGERLIVNDLIATQTFEMRTLADYARLNEERHPVLTR